MPGTNAATTGGGNIPGLNLRAWALFMGSNPATLVKSGGVSSVAWVSAGKWDVNLTTAMADTNVVVKAESPNAFPVPTSTNYAALVAGSVTTAKVQVATFVAGAAANVDQLIWVGIYG